ncbi:MAG TPA: hypothetical protein VF251_11465 [Pyrinomonadaceae bacterium]
MTTVRCNLNPNRSIPTVGPTVFKTERNQHPLRCGVCGKVTYVDEDAFTFINYAIQAGLDDPFHCEWCSEVSPNAA